jgi:outer membrane protein assembly factor BamB
MSTVGRRAACAGVAATLLQAVACRRSRGTRDDNGSKGTSTATVKRHREPLLHLAFTDAHTLTSASADAACAWDVQAARLLWHVPLDRPFNPGETRPGMIPEFDDDAKLVAALERAGVTIHRADGTVQPIGASSALGNGRLVGLGPGGTSIIAALGDTVVVRRIADGATIFERSDLGGVRGRSRDRRLLALQDTKHTAPDRKLHVVDVTTGSVLSSIDVIGGGVLFSDDGKDLVLGVDRSLVVFDVATGKKRLDIPLPMETSDGTGQQPKPEDFAPLAFAKGTIVAQHTRAELVTFDAATGQRRAFFPAPNTIGSPTGGTSIDVTADARFAAALAADFLYRFDFSRSNLLEPRDITPPLPIGTLAASLPILRGTTHVAIAPDGRWVAFGGSNGVFALDAESIRHVATRLDPS